MRSQRSIIVPVFIILAGVLFELSSLGIFGELVPVNVLAKLWPLLGAAAALDLLFVQRRLIGAMVVMFFSAALLSTQFLDGGWNNPVWEFFMKVWPLLLVLFGIDSIFSGRSLINTAVIIAGILILIYVALTVLDIPALKQLPFDLSSILPASPYSDAVVPQPSAPQYSPLPDPASGSSLPQNSMSVISVGPGGQISAAMPSQNAAALNLSAAAGKISIKAGNTGAQFLSGTVQLMSPETLTADGSQNGNAMVYTLKSSGPANPSSTSDWDLQLTTQRYTAINTVLNSGYIKADLRGLNLSDVSIRNKVGPIDVMVPQMSEAKISITADNGDIRVYIPKNSSINCVIKGTSNVEYPQMSYTFVNGILAPRRTVQTPVTVEVNSNNGWVRIIESE